MNDTPHAPGEKPPKDLGLKPIHARRPHEPLQHRVFLPTSRALPEHLHDIPRHYPLLRYRLGDITPIEGWEPREAADGLWEVDLEGVALWFDGVEENEGDHPARALRDLPSIWNKTTGRPKPKPDWLAINHFDRSKAAAYVDFFGGQKLERLEEKPFLNDVVATLRIARDATPKLVWMPFLGSTSTADIKPGAEIQIANIATSLSPCEERDYLLHYRATLLDLREQPPPYWEEQGASGPGPDRPFCSNSTYP